jgi:hypothetical protein
MNIYLIILLGFHLLLAAKDCLNDQVVVAFIRVFSCRFEREVGRYEISTKW